MYQATPHHYQKEKDNSIIEEQDHQYMSAVAESQVTHQLTAERKEQYGVWIWTDSVNVLYAQFISIYLMATAVHTKRRIVFQRKRSDTKTA
ncbi:TPA: hypothetical protein EYO57_04980 [Candidatus Poribacteria bacterium]|nr:hypothetical protein [Candidatus Poribacteria bacterium]